MANRRYLGDSEEEDTWSATWLDRHYSGAPDECSIHWPTKGVTGECPECRAASCVIKGCLNVPVRQVEMFGQLVWVCNGRRDRRVWPV